MDLTILNSNNDNNRYVITIELIVKIQQNIKTYNFL